MAMDERVKNDGVPVVAVEETPESGGPRAKGGEDVGDAGVDQGAGDEQGGCVEGSPTNLEEIRSIVLGDHLVDAGVGVVAKGEEGNRGGVDAVVSGEGGGDDAG